MRRAATPAPLTARAARPRRYWVSLNGPSQTFWAHEYEKHGTCAEDVFRDQLSFMNGTLALRSAYDLTPALAAAGITPSATKGFSPAALQAAATAAFGFPVLPSCDKDGNIGALRPGARGGCLSR